MANKKFHSGFVALVGSPNAGKSTLMNYIMRQKIAAVSPKPQTTRRRQLGIFTTDEAQMIFMDTPGVHRPLHRLGQYMNEEALIVLTDADVILWLVDASRHPNEEDRILAENMARVVKLPPVVLVLNKIDQIKPGQVEERRTVYQKLLPESMSIPISALTGAGCDALLDMVADHLPEGPMYYEEDQITDLYEREIAVDLIREAALNNLREEVPHSMAVLLDAYEDRGDKAAYISATLFVERDSHKGIVIGKRGSMLKRIGSEARHEIEELTERKVFLELRVKVSKNWRNDVDMLQRLGYVARKAD